MGEFSLKFGVHLTLGKSGVDRRASTTTRFDAAAPIGVGDWAEPSATRMVTAAVSSTGDASLRVVVSPKARPPEVVGVIRSTVEPLHNVAEAADPSADRLPRRRSPLPGRGPAFYRERAAIVAASLRPLKDEKHVVCCDSNVGKSGHEARSISSPGFPRTPLKDGLERDSLKVVLPGCVLRRYLSHVRTLRQS